MQSKICVVAFVLVAAYTIGFVSGSEHYNVAVRGALFCNDTPYDGGHIELYDYDFFYADVKLGEVISEKSGKFYVEGGRWEWVPMVPFIQISEKCHGDLKCWKLWIPPDYQWTDGNPKKVYAMGSFNLTDPQVSSC
ncbi:hypothetical protein M3Y97_00529000 [Aphelenchoides bicaudatus]|nr:hypothetical protein M3Y97_00529000 [Aphelenchoides bicaudatus]